MKKFINLFILLLPTLGIAKQKTKLTHPETYRKIEQPATPEKEEEELIYEPWFTGPLLPPLPINMDPKHPAIEPSITILDVYGNYNDDWKVKSAPTIISLNPFVDFAFGITKYIGIEIQAGAFTNFQHGKSSTHFEDTAVLLGFQLSNDKKGTWVPDFRFIIEEIFPTGNFQKFDPDKVDIEETGLGSFQTGPVLAFQKLFYLPKNFFALRGSIGYFFPTRVHVKGFNFAGGGFGTNGRVKLGQTLQIFISGEYSISQRWVFAFDTETIYQRRSPFSGKAGFTAPGVPATVGLPSHFQFSFAPEMEYNFSDSAGLLWGLWFSLFGRNAPAFAAGFIAFAYVF